MYPDLSQLLDLLFWSEIKMLVCQGLPHPDLKDELKDKLISAYNMMGRNAVRKSFDHMRKCSRKCQEVQCVNLEGKKVEFLITTAFSNDIYCIFKSF